jgi:peptide/nickel transport system ATP-binding protein/oligopeptide transport system ATP-binding protein
MRELRQDFGTSLLLITHDLGVIAESVEEVIVMYAGRVVEQAEVVELFHHPLHPYTRGLMHSVPALAASAARKRLTAIPGVVPSLFRLPAGCKFSDRCIEAFDRCRVEPALFRPGHGHAVRCWLHAGGGT